MHQPVSDQGDERPSAPSAHTSGAGAPSAMPTTRSLRQRIDDHPAGLFVGIAIAAATATLGIVLPIAQLTQDSRVASVQAELAQVRSEQRLVVDGLQAQLEQARRDADTAMAD
jgi:hypothetical protein